MPAWDSFPVNVIYKPGEHFILESEKDKHASGKIKSSRAKQQMSRHDDLHKTSLRDYSSKDYTNFKKPTNEGKEVDWKDNQELCGRKANFGKALTPSLDSPAHKEDQRLFLDEVDGKKNWQTPYDQEILDDDGNPIPGTSTRSVPPSRLFRSDDPGDAYGKQKFWHPSSKRGKAKDMDGKTRGLRDGRQSVYPDPLNRDDLVLAPTNVQKLDLKAGEAVVAVHLKDTNLPLKARGVVQSMNEDGSLNIVWDHLPQDEQPEEITTAVRQNMVRKEPVQMNFVGTHKVFESHVCSHKQQLDKQMIRTAKHSQAAEEAAANSPSTRAPSSPGSPTKGWDITGPPQVNLTKLFAEEEDESPKKTTAAKEAQEVIADTAEETPA